MNVEHNVTSVTVTATLQDTNASMEVNGQETSSGQAREIFLGDEGVEHQHYHSR
ncbi:MAG: cadherin-like beta sandwich domain-containing protein [Nitrospira sp.]|nr:cadherin-like beta sandwich domain-containing protein [Nitrospira sp.]